VSSQYVFLQNVDEEERKRLSHFEAYLDGYTAQRLDRIGIAAGWRCLEVGAGRGSVAKMLSSRVGASGSVLAADIDLRFLTELPANVKVRRHDIETEDLGEALYDLIHCRAMLMWLRDPAKALQRMMLALKPGGWLLAEELDWGFCTVGGHPDAGWATEYMHELFKRHEAAGIRHPYFGRTLAAFVAEAGFADLNGELAATIGLDTSAALEVIRRTVRALRAPSISMGESASDLDRLDAVLASPQAIVVGITSIGVQARKLGSK
jgi:SAM-dependent methyltransferase